MDPIIREVLDVLVQAAIVGVGGAVVAFVRQRSTSEKQAEARARIATLAQTAVLEQWQRRVSAAKASEADGAPVGKVSEATASAAKGAAVDFVAEFAGAATHRALESAMGNAGRVRRYIEGEIEAAVARAKSKPATLAQANEASKALGSAPAPREGDGK